MWTLYQPLEQVHGSQPTYMVAAAWGLGVGGLSVSSPIWCVWVMGVYSSENFKLDYLLSSRVLGSEVSGRQEVCSGTPRGT